ncbi:DUF4123 domain-containing protein [Pseudomonas sp. GD03867]|uniref:DUF4123 domain-containing protein n=1 Tax=Pseudomonas sp. GD03867 TaxID=2975393 RepID=UPI00244C3951|nr:DUF4123 domain-containing protein [Pseudomonas sp. GD03867]MDH0650325.1 DUF4123 domain-containing protein [Pseudomonas sp. GD03867]
MSNPFIDALVGELRASARYRLSAIVEMAHLSSAARDKFAQYYAQRCWPLLQQPAFASLQAAGPWLVGARPGSDVRAQYDFMGALEYNAPNAVCGWIISPLPPEQLARHLSQANIVTGADGHSYLLRYHTTASLQLLDSRRDLPGVSQWLSPIHRWWVPMANPDKKLWLQISGDGQPTSPQVPPITLDEAFWTALAGDPLSHRLAQMLDGHPPLAGHCHGTRLGLVQHYLEQARSQGLSREEDLVTFVLLMSSNAEQLRQTPAWHDALAATRAQQTTLSDNLQACLHRSPG